MDKKSSEESRYRKLFTAWKSGEHAHLLVQARRFLTDYPDNHVAWVLFGIGLYEIARYDEARKALLRAIKLCPPKWLYFPYVQMGHLYKEKGNHRTAARWYRRASRKKPDDAGPYIFLGAALAKQGLLTEAEKAHRRATRCQRGCIDEAYLNLGLILRARERLEEALSCFQKALELNPKYKGAQSAIRDVIKAMEWLEVNIS